MYSSAARSTFPTIPGQRYVLTIANLSGGDVTPFVHCLLPSGSGIIVFLTPENSTQHFLWVDGEVKHVTFTAWGHAIHLTNYSASVLWDLRPLVR